MPYARRWHPRSRRRQPPSIRAVQLPGGLSSFQCLFGMGQTNPNENCENARMLLGCLYLAANVAALYVLYRLAYGRLWPILLTQISLTCWQTGIILCISPTSRIDAIHWWLPGDAVLLLLSAGAIFEGWWRGMNGFPHRHKVGVCLSLLGGMVFLGLCLRWILIMPQYVDWFEQLKADRLIWNLCAATLAIIAVGVACTLNRAQDPRFVRMHVGLLAVLAGGHVLFADLTHWTHSNALYRGLEVACLLGWIVNASLVRTEGRLLGFWRAPGRASNRSRQSSLPQAVPVAPLPSPVGLERRRLVAAEDYVWPSGALAGKR